MCNCVRRSQHLSVRYCGHLFSSGDLLKSRSVLKLLAALPVWAFVTSSFVTSSFVTWAFVAWVFAFAGSSSAIAGPIDFDFRCGEDFGPSGTRAYALTATNGGVSLTITAMDSNEEVTIRDDGAGVRHGINGQIDGDFGREEWITLSFSEAMSTSSLDVGLGRYNLNTDNVEIYVQDSSNSVDQVAAEGAMNPSSSGSLLRHIDFGSIGGLPDTFDTLVIYSRDSTHPNSNRDSKFFLTELTVQKTTSPGGVGGTSVPEPGSLGILALLLGSLFVWQRWRH